MRILIVDDEKTAHQLYKLMLITEGHTFFHAHNGQEAVEIFTSNPDIDLILMDIRMPVMNGYVAAKKIRKLNEEVIIFAQTAFDLAEDKRKALEAGCNDHLAKPFDSRVLRKKIAQYFKSSRSATSSAGF